MPLINKATLALIVSLILIVAIAPRIYQLGKLGFSGDEEITSLASYSFAEQGVAKMPSGLPYNRALPHTWINSLSIKLFGIQNEFSYRAPSLLFGILTVLLIFYMAKRTFGIEVACVAAILLALSDWHITISREARMYAPFLFFYLASTYSFIHWHQNRKNILSLIIWIVCTLLAITLHNLGIFCALVPLYLLITDKKIKIPSQVSYSVMAITIALITFVYHKYFVTQKFLDWINFHGKLTSTQTISSAYYMEIFNSVSQNFWLISFIFVAIILAIYFYFHNVNNTQTSLSSFQKLALFCVWMLAFIFSFAGQIYGTAILLVIALLIHSDNLNFISQCKFPLTLLAITSCVWLIWSVSQHGLIAGLKLAANFPYPYISYFAELSIGLLIFFSLGVIVSLFSKAENYAHIKLFVLATIVPITLIGLIEKWGALRYIIVSYPFFILISTYGLISSIKFLLAYLDSKNPTLIATGVTLLITCSGVLGHSGIPQAWKSANKGYDSNSAAQFNMGTQNHPDHKTPGEYVKTRLQHGDIVVAEDALQQYWYIGQVDYWLRNIQTHGHFTYKSDENTQILDTYINSVVVVDDIVDQLRTKNKQRIWLITSAETERDKPFYLNKKQLRWLEDLQNTHSPVYVGLDNITQVYCINCDG